jgi:alpha-tubulin suppressor-like RCC1 family protein
VTIQSEHSQDTFKVPRRCGNGVPRRAWRRKSLVPTLLVVCLWIVAVGASPASAQPSQVSRAAGSALTATPSKSVLEKGEVLRVRGKITPITRGRVVVLQVRRNGRWATLAESSTNKASRYRTSVRLRGLGTHRFRSYAPATPRARAAVSKRFTVTVRRPLAIASTTMGTGVAGLPVVGKLEAVGGTGGTLTWSARGLPDGVQLSPVGVLSGAPTETGTHRVAVTVRNSNGGHAVRDLTLAIPAAMPPECIDGPCAELTNNARTQHIDAATITDLTRDPETEAVTSLTTTADPPAVGDQLVFSAGELLPSGLIAVVDAVEEPDSGHSRLQVTPATLADAYAEGAVKVQPADPVAMRSTSKQSASVGARLSCGGGVDSALHGMSLTPSIEPSMAAIWAHPMFGGGGIYPGAGGLELAQIDLTTRLEVNFGVEVSGAATCTLQLPAYRAAVPAGNLGAVIVTVAPSLTLKVSGTVDIRATADLSCTTQYRWSEGAEYRANYCRAGNTPMKIRSGTGVDASLTGKLGVSVTLNEIVGVTGDVSATLRAGYHPTRRPVAQLDAQVDYSVGGCLACWWKESPARVTVASGTIFDNVLWTSDNPAAPGDEPQIVTTTLPPATIGTAYQTRLATADNRNGTWSITAGGLPAGLILNANDGTISGTPAGPADTYTFTVGFRDPGGAFTTRALVLNVSARETPTGAWQAISAGASATCGIQLDRSISCWGGDQYAGPVDSQTSHPYPYRIGSDTDWALVSTGNRGSCAIKTSGALWCWGGGAGLGYIPAPPQQMTSHTDWVDVSVGDTSACGIREDGSAWCWGSNYTGQLGNGTRSEEFSPPSRIPGDAVWTDITVGYMQACGVQAGGSLWCWGGNLFEAAGQHHYLYEEIYSPMRVLGSTSAQWESVDAGDGYGTCALTTTSEVYCWGAQGFGEGPQSPGDSVLSHLDSSTASVTTGALGGCALHPDRSVWCWGELTGDGTDELRMHPVQVANGAGQWAAIDSGTSHTCALRTDGTAWCWGNNSQGQVGDGTVNDRLVPTKVA